MHIPHHMPFAMAATFGREPNPKASDAEVRDYAWIADCLDASQRKKPRPGADRHSNASDLHEEEFPGEATVQNCVAALPLEPFLMVKTLTQGGNASTGKAGDGIGALKPSELNRLLDDLCRQVSTTSA